MIKINLIRLRDVEAIHGQHLEMIDLSGRLLGRLWHGYHLELFDRGFFFLSHLFLFSFNRFRHDDVEHTIERGSKLSVPLREALWEQSVFSKNTTHSLGQVSNSGLSTRSPVHWP